jgi:hypothetical protein
MQSMSENSVMGMPNRVSAQGQISGDLGASGKAQGMLNTSQNATSSIANQGLISLPGTGLITNQGASSSSNSGKVSAEGKLIGEQAQVQGLLDLKNSYGKDQKIKLQLDQQAKSITDIIPQSDENINLINKIKDFPELASLFNNPSNTPEFIASIISSYNKNETDSLEGWNIIPGVGASAKYGHYISGNNNLQASSQVNRSRTQTQEYDPTPNDPTSGDEVQLANVGGRVVAIPKGQLITQNYKNSVSTYSPEYDVAMNNYISNGQQGDVPVNTGDIYTKDYDYNQYFWANGDNQDVNMLMGGLMSRAYDDQAGYDYTGADSIYNQIRGLDSTASWGGYNYSQLQSMADMYDLERQRDLSGYSLSDNYNKSSSYNYRAY